MLFDVGSCGPEPFSGMTKKANPRITRLTQKRTYSARFFVVVDVKSSPRCVRFHCTTKRATASLFYPQRFIASDPDAIPSL